VEICSACHPFFTGKQKLVDTAGRIDRFKKRYNIKEELISPNEKSRPLGTAFFSPSPRTRRRRSIARSVPRCSS
jgi:hypothetical protein